ncbi:MAG: phage tail protein [Anaerococcus vaginalis]|nr:phage tail protein [Anaerococcus vaginalis]
MLVYGLNNETCSSFYFFKNLEIKKEINKLDISCFEIPKEYRNIFKTECKVTENKQSYTIKNIEPFYDGYKIECKQNIDDWLSFFHKSLNFPYKNIETMIKGIIPSGWSYIINGEIKKHRTITADHKSSWEVLEEIVKKFDVEYRLDNEERKIFISEKIGEDKGAFFSDDFNIVDKDISVESFEFATRIIPEGMNGLKINQINDGKDYLENKSYSGKTIIYYWKDERYTNIQNLKNEAARKLEVLSRPRITIKLKVKDLSEAIGIYQQEYNIGDYVYLIDKDRKTKERFRILAQTTYPNRPFNNEITLANKALDLSDDVDETVELTKKMWEETRVRFETTENAIKSSVATAKKYSDDSFKTYKTEREQTDSRIYESITESTTYVDPKTGQTKPIIDKQLEIDKTVEGINITVYEQKNSLDKLSSRITQTASEISSRVSKDLENMNSRISQTAKDISFKVSKGELSSLVKQEFDKYTVQARNINFDGSFVNVKGTFQTLNNNDDIGIKINYNNIKFQDNRWDNKVFGAINVTKQISGAEGFSLNMGHYKDGYLGLSYFSSSDGLWHDYVNFDIYGKSRFSTSGYATSFLETVKFNKTVLFDSNVHFSSSATFETDCKFERNITFGGNRVRFVNYSDGFGIVNEKGEGLYVAGSGAVYVQDTQYKHRVATK